MQRFVKFLERMANECPDPAYESAGKLFEAMFGSRSFHATPGSVPPAMLRIRNQDGPVFSDYKGIMKTVATRSSVNVPDAAPDYPNPAVSGRATRDMAAETKDAFKEDQAKKWSLTEIGKNSHPKQMYKCSRNIQQMMKDAPGNCTKYVECDVPGSAMMPLTGFCLAQPGYGFRNGVDVGASAGGGNANG